MSNINDDEKDARCLWADHCCESGQIFPLGRSVQNSLMQNLTFSPCDNDFPIQSVYERANAKPQLLLPAVSKSTLDDVEAALDFLVDAHLMIQNTRWDEHGEERFDPWNENQNNKEFESYLDDVNERSKDI